MAVQLSQPEFQRLVRIVQNLDDFRFPDGRYQFLTFTFGNDDRAKIILGRLNLSGTAMGTAVEVVNFLCKYGQVSAGVEALGVFLDQILENRGQDADSDFMAEIIDKHKLSNPPAPKTASVPVVVPTPAPVPEAKEKYIFISYARPEQAIADQVEAYLKAAGFRVFRDIRDIRPGNNWDITIETALQESTHMVLLLSAASMPYRKEVHREWFYYDQEKRPIVPLYVQKCMLHSRMYAYNYIDAQTDLADALPKLVAALV